MTASVEHVKRVKWGNSVATYYELDLSFEDKLGTTHWAKTDFINKSKEGFPAWVGGDFGLRLEFGKDPETMEICYDLLNPKRIWGKREPWNRANAIHYLFAALHLFQTIACFGLASVTF